VIPEAINDCIPKGTILPDQLSFHRDNEITGIPFQHHETTIEGVEFQVLGPLNASRVLAQPRVQLGLV
jgi:hypothetical protein